MKLVINKIRVRGQDRCKRSFPGQRCALRKFLSDRRSKRASSDCFQCIPFIFKGSPNNWLHMYVARICNRNLWISIADSFGRPQNNKKQQQKVVYCNILYVSGVSSFSGQQVSVRLFISLQGGVGAYFYFHAYVVILNFLLSKFKLFATVRSTR